VINLKIQGDTNKLKEGYKVKITGHIKGKGNGATMEGNSRSEEALACFFADPDVRGLNTTPSDFMVLILSFNSSCNVLI
jgi:hypothetical protein